LVCQKVIVRCRTNYWGRIRGWRWERRVRREVTERGVSSKKVN
jgi:hypothetical protein